MGDSWSVPTPPTEQTLNYWKGKRAARQKIKEEKTFQRELFTGHDSGASDVPLQPGSLRFRMHRPLPSFFIPCFTVEQRNAVRSSRCACFIIALRRPHRTLFVTSKSCSESSPTPFQSRHIYKPPDGGNDICSSSGGDDESRHLANPSGALYASDLHVSTCSKYNLPCFSG